MKTYKIKGMIEITLPPGAGFDVDRTIKSYSEKQALRYLAYKLKEERGYNFDYIYARILRSNLKIREIK